MLSKTSQIGTRNVLWQRYCSRLRVPGDFPNACPTPETGFAPGFQTQEKAGQSKELVLRIGLRHFFSQQGSRKRDEEKRKLGKGQGRREKGTALFPSSSALILRSGTLVNCKFNHSPTSSTLPALFFFSSTIDNWISCLHRALSKK